MRLVATGRALRIAWRQRSVAVVPGYARSSSPAVSVQRHRDTRPFSSSPPAQQGQQTSVAGSLAKSTEEQPASAAETEPQLTITAGDKSYPADEWTNVPANILSHIGRNTYLDKNHPLSITRRLIESQFPGPEYGNHVETQPIVSTAQNFDDLGFPADHPGRNRTDSYYINKDTILRTHTSAHQRFYFQRMNVNETVRPDENGYTVTADVYRRDAIDRSHYPVFHQLECARLWKRCQDSSEGAARIMQDVASLPQHNVPVDDPNPTVHPERNPLQKEHSLAEVDAVAAHLKRSLENLVIRIFSAAREASEGTATITDKPLEIRWVEAYFPFTSPSWELEVFWEGEWLELLGCGVVKQELLNSSDVPHRMGWAFGLGLERIAMLLFNIPDIRLFWSRDPRFLSQFQEGKFTRFVPFSKYPPCYKDVAFWLRSSTGSVGSAAGGVLPFHENDVMEIVRDLAGDVVEDVRLVDEFTHPKTGKKSMCYRINYRSLEKTLTNEEVNSLHDKLRERLVQQLGVELR